MRHRVAHRKLGRDTQHRISLLRNQAQALLRHEHLETTVPKAKELRPFVERLITVAKRGVVAGKDNQAAELAARRLVLRDIPDREVVSKLFTVLAPRFSARPGGYTRLLPIGRRRGDQAPVAQIELLGSEFNPKAAAEKKAAKEKSEGAAKPKGVGGRLRAAADRLRGKRAGGEETAPAADTDAASEQRAAARKGSGGSRRAPGRSAK
jgi:large subunit ribosomal protein L17